LVLSLSQKPHSKHTVDHGPEKTDKVALVSCMIGSMKHVKQLPEDSALTPSGATDAHVVQLIKVATEILPKDANFAA
jgi:hypothetical protein